MNIGPRIGGTDKESWHAEHLTSLILWLLFFHCLFGVPLFEGGVYSYGYQQHNKLRYIWVIQLGIEAMKPFTLLGMIVCIYVVHSTHELVYSKLLNLGILFTYIE